jgi:hypothetical protein
VPKEPTFLITEPRTFSGTGHSGSIISRYNTMPADRWLDLPHATARHHRTNTYWFRMFHFKPRLSNTARTPRRYISYNQHWPALRTWSADHCCWSRGTTNSGSFVRRSRTPRRSEIRRCGNFTEHQHWYTIPYKSSLVTSRTPDILTPNNFPRHLHSRHSHCSIHSLTLQST